MATHSPGDTKGKRKGKGKGKSKAHHTDPPTRVLLQRFYPLVLPLPLYLSALLPQSSSSHGTAHPLVGSNGGLSQPGSSQNTQLWWLSDGDEVPPFPVLNRKGLGTDRTEEMQDTILNALRGLVVCVSDINEAGRLRAILEHQRHDQDPTSPRRASEDEREGFSRDLPWAKQNASGSASGKGQWCEWTPPNAERLSQIEGEDIVELVRHSQQIIVKRILASRSSSSFPDRNVLTAGYKANDGRSGAIRVAGRAPKSLTNFYINTLVTSITTGLEWHALLESVGGKIFIHLLTSTAIFQAVPGSNDCFVQVCGRPLQDLAELVSSAAQRTSKESTMETPAESSVSRRKRSGKRKRAASADSGGRTVAGPKDIAIKFPSSRGSIRRISSINSFVEETYSMAGDLGGPANRAAKSASTSVRLRKPSEISFVRSRLFYARPVRTKQGKVHIGLPFIHCIVRSAETRGLAKMTALSPSQETRIAKASRPSVTRVSRPTKLASQAQFDLRVRHVLKYIFPRQHGLHNVFTSVVDRTQTTQAFPDYTMRDAEIRARGRAKTPKRLMPIRGMLQTLLRRIDNFDFKRTLNRCCPSRLPRRPMTQSERAEMAADLSEVDPANIATQVQRTIEASQGAFASSQALLQPPRTQLLPAASQRGQNSQSQATVKARLVTERQVKEKPRFYKYAISMGQVSHFVYVVLKSILPRGLLGSQHNMNMVLRRASEFVSGRRYETLSLHEVLQGIRITDIPWLLPVNPRAQAQRSTAVESQLRHELFAELAYWIFDSVLIPLLRTTFYITESAAFRNRTLYFRQDDWAAASAPLLDALKTSLFTPITHREALQVMSGRNLGYSHIRLLPKEAGVRPIVNLRRRSIKQTNPAEAKPSGPYKTEASEKLALNQSINNILQSAFHILTYERSHQPEVMGASVFGMNDIFRCLKRFRAATSHLRKGSEQPRLYFVKVDVQAAFDSIEQGKLLDIVRRILSGEEYLIQRFAEIMPAGGKVKKNFVKRACLDSEHGTFAELAQVLADSLRHVIFVDGVVYGHEERQRVLTLLEQHIEGNLVKIGREFFKQRIGIPQGSSLSTLLCSFFYADMERSDPRLMPVGTVQQHQEIGAAAAATTQQVSNSSVSMLMRYTDDFLFISTSRRRAKAFFKAMLRGHPEYGCFISPAKTVANFDLSFPDGGFVPQIRERTIKRRRHGGARFTGTAASAGPSEFVRVGAQLPWCGILINTATLAVSSDLSRYEDLHIADTLTVETGRKPGSTLMTKLLQSIQTRSNLILIDTGLNGDVGAHINIYHSCLLAALKLLVYARIIGVDPVSQCDWLLGILKLAATFQYTTIAARVKSAVRNPASPPTRALAKTAGDGSASAATQASSATAKALAVQCSLRQNNVRWLALHAFRRVFSTRPAQWHAVVKALDEEIAAVRPGRGTAAGATTRRGTAATFRLPLTLSSSTKRVAQQDDTPKATLFSADAMELDEDEDGQQAGGAANVGGTAAELAANGPLSLPSSSAHRGAGTTRPCSSSGSSKTARLQALLTTPERAMAAGGAALLAGVRY